MATLVLTLALYLNNTVTLILALFLGILITIRAGKGRNMLTFTIIILFLAGLALIRIYKIIFKEIKNINK